MLRGHVQYGIISIHAPAWGATPKFLYTLEELKKFQSTLPHGERPIQKSQRYTTTDISIHAPAWGATAKT